MGTGLAHKVAENEGMTLRDTLIEATRQLGHNYGYEGPGGDDLISERDVSDYYKRKLDEAKQELAEWRAMSLDERVSKVRDMREKDVAYHEKSAERDIAAADRLDAILEQAELWQPPTPKHEKLKEIVTKQLREAAESARDVSYIETFRSMSVDVDDYESELESKVVRYTEHWQREVQRVNETNEWLRQLREALPER